MAVPVLRDAVTINEIVAVYHGEIRMRCAAAVTDARVDHGETDSGPAIPCSLNLSAADVFDAPRVRQLGVDRVHFTVEVDGCDVRVLA
jgi:hypothetical protein